MARAYNIEKFKKGTTKFTCPAQREGERAVTRVFIGVDQQTRKLKFQTWNGTRGVGRPLDVDAVPDGWKLA